MKAKVQVRTSFDSFREYERDGDEFEFKEFFNDEGEYLDNLVSLLKEQGKQGDSFEVDFKIKVSK